MADQERHTLWLDLAAGPKMRLGARFRARLRVSLRFVHHRSARLAAAGARLRQELDQLEAELTRKNVTTQYFANTQAEEDGGSQDRANSAEDSERASVKSLSNLSCPVAAMLDNLLSEEDAVGATKLMSSPKRDRGGGKSFDMSSTAPALTPVAARSAADILGRARPMRGGPSAPREAAAPTAARRNQSVQSAAATAMAHARNGGLARSVATTKTAAAPLAARGQSDHFYRKVTVARPADCFDGGVRPGFRQQQAQEQQRSKPRGVSAVIRSPTYRKKPRGADRDGRFCAVTNEDVTRHKAAARFFGR